MQYNYNKNNAMHNAAPVAPSNSFGGVKQAYVIVIAAVILVVLTVIFFTLTSGPSSSKTMEIKQSNSDVSPSINNIRRVKEPKQSPNTPVDISSIKLTGEKDSFDIDLALSTWTAYRFQFSNEHKTLDLILFNTSIAKEKKTPNSEVKDRDLTLSVDGIRLIGDFAARGIQVSTYMHNDDLNLVMNFPDSMHIKEAHITKSHPSALTMSFVKTKEADIVVLPEVKNGAKKVNSLAVDYHDNANAIIAATQNLINFGRYDEAIAQIKENPVAIYENEDLCEMLIKVYLKKQMYVQAESISSQGVTIFPDSTNMRKLWAQSNFALQNYSKAFAILKDHAPEIASNIEYYSLLASVALKLQKYEFASGIYRSLLSFKPANADWWAGLAITLQGLGKNNLALEAYHRALSVGTLSSDLIGYVRGQIQNLQ